MTKVIKKQRAETRRRGDPDGCAETRDNILQARDPLAYAAVLKILG